MVFELLHIQSKSLYQSSPQLQLCKKTNSLAKDFVKPEKGRDKAVTRSDQLCWLWLDQSALIWGWRVMPWSRPVEMNIHKARPVIPRSIAFEDQDWSLRSMHATACEIVTLWLAQRNVTESVQLLQMGDDVDSSIVYLCVGSLATSLRSLYLLGVQTIYTVGTNFRQFRWDGEKGNILIGFVLLGIWSWWL